MDSDRSGASLIGTIYWVGAWIVFVVAFFGCWLYRIISSGILFGFFFGWIPSLFIAALVAILWPLLVAVLIWLLSR